MAPQSMPAGELVMVPLPEPDLLTLSVSAWASAGSCKPEMIETSAKTIILAVNFMVRLPIRVIPGSADVTARHRHGFGSGPVGR